MTSPTRRQGSLPCPCSSGLVRRECCFDPEKLREYVFDHPKLNRLLTTRALNTQHARLNFKRAWERMAKDGTLAGAGLRIKGAPPGTVGRPVDRHSFALGAVKLDDGQEPPAVPEDYFGDDEVPGEFDETWLS